MLNECYNYDSKFIKLIFAREMSNENEGQNIEGEATGSRTSNLNLNGSRKWKIYKPRWDVWVHFTKFLDKDGRQREKCNYCPSDLCGDGNAGTSTLRAHVRNCKSNPAHQDDIQSKLEINTNTDDQTGESKVSLQAYKFDQQNVGKQ